MKIMIYGIGGKLEAGASGDCHIGTANDRTTYRSLLKMVGLMGGYAVSLHGTFDGYHSPEMLDEDITNPISGEYSLPEAYAMLREVEATEMHGLVNPLPQQAWD